MADFTPQQVEQVLQQFFDAVGTRQYIGARYVPIFGRKGEGSIEWDDTAPYEPLTVVMHEGVSYVSRQYVPKGVSINNVDYWAETYRFNAQVEQYRQEVLSFADAIQTVQNNVDSLRNDVADDYVPFPDGTHYPKFGTSGQVLSTLADGTTKWENPVVPSDSQAEEIITEWLTEHPEATTTVQDGSLSLSKFNSELIRQLTINSPHINTSNYQVVLPDANYANNNTLYMFSIPNGTTGPTLNLPHEKWDYGDSVGMLICEAATQWALQTQLFIVANGIYRRVINTTSHTEQIPWERLYDIDDYIKLMEEYVTTANYSTVLPDANYANRNTLYMLNLQGNSSNIPSNLPYSTWPLYATCATLETISTSGTWPICMQRLTMYKEIWVRIINTNTHAVVNNWVCIAKNTVEKYDIYVSKGLIPANIYPESNVFDNLTEAIYYASVTHEGEVNNVYILDGEYDLVSEFEAKFDSLEDFNTATDFNGFALGLRIGSFNVIGYGNNKISFIYNGDNTFIHNRFSPFTNYWQSQKRTPSVYKLEGLNIEVQNCQYCIHDELSAISYDYVTEQRHEIKQCYLKKTISEGLTITPQVIGGGMGTNTKVIIDGCIFETNGGNNADIVSYHNGKDESCQGFIEITNCYFVNGGFRVSYYGESTVLTKAICSGNSFTKQPSVTQESSQYTTVNVVLFAWNNEIRS